MKRVVLQYRPRFLGIFVLTLLMAGLSTPVQAQPPQKGARAGGMARMAPDRVLVKFQGLNSGASATTRRQAANAAQQAHAQAGGQMLRQYRNIDWQLVKLPKGLTVAQGVARYKAQAGVLAAEPDYERRAFKTPNETDFTSGTLYGLNKISAPAAWDSSTGSANVVVAVIDSGVDYNHPDLSANMWRNTGEIAGNGLDDDSNGYTDDIYGIDTAKNDSNPMDVHGHGTHVAGTIGAVGNNGVGVVGVNWNVKIMALRSLDENNSGFTSDSVDAMDYMLTMKQRGVNIRVSNHSYGSTGFSQAEKDAFDNAATAGIVSACAAGNDSLDNDGSDVFPANYDSPGIISVAASDQSDNEADFSNIGATTVDLAAPGVGIKSTHPLAHATPNYNTMDGTSMATPHVAGAAALIFAARGNQFRANVKAAILNTVDVLPQWSGRVATGGRLNVAAALNSTALQGPVFGQWKRIGDVLDPTGGETIDDVDFVRFTINTPSGGGISKVHLSIKRQVDGKFWNFDSPGWTTDESRKTLTDIPGDGSLGVDAIITEDLPTPADLKNGNYVFTAVAESLAGAIGRSASITMKVNNPANYPTVTIADPNHNSSVNDVDFILGTLTDPGGQGFENDVVTLTLRSGNEYYNGTIWVESETPITFTAPITGTTWGYTTMPGFDNAVYELTAVVTDKAGFTSPVVDGTNKITFTFDNVPPSVTYSAPPATTYRSAVRVAGGALDNFSVAAVRLKLRSTTLNQWWNFNTGNWGTETDVPATLASPNSSITTWEYLLPRMPVGSYQLHARAVDAAGNAFTSWTTRNFSIQADNTPPTATIDSIESGQVIETYTLPTIAGTAADAQSGIQDVGMYLMRSTGTGFVYWTGSAWSSTATALATTYTESSGDPNSGTWTAPNGYNLPSGVNLPNGDYQIQISARNNAVTTGSIGATVAFSVDFHPTYTWTGATLRDNIWNNDSDNWGTPENWSYYGWEPSSGVPGTGDVVIISNGDTVRSSISRTVFSFNLSSGNLDFDNSSHALTITKRSSWTGGGLNDNIEIPVGATMTVSGAATKYLGAAAVLNNNGTITWNGAGDIRNNNGANGANIATINNKSGATFRLNADGTPFSVDYHASNFNNQSGATLIKSAGTGTTVLQHWTFNNAGTIQCNTGTIEHTSTLNLNTGSVLAGAGVLQLKGSTVLNSEVNSGLNVVLAAGNLTGSYDINNNPLASYKGAGRFDWTGGTINGNLSLAVGATMSVSGVATKYLGAAAVLNNNGTVNWAGAGDIRNNNGANGANIATINNKSGATFRLTTDGIPFSVDYNASIFNNQSGATLVKSAGSGTTKLQHWTFNNVGTIKCDVGTLEHTSTLNSGAGSLFSGAGVHLASAGSLNINGASTISGPTFNVSGGTINGSGGSIVTTSGGSFDWSGGTVEGTLNLNSGTFRISGTDRKTMGHGSVINNSGTLTWTGTGDIRNNNGANPGNVATFNNKSGGVFNAQNDTLFSRDYNASTFNNQAGATFNKSSSSGTTIIDWVFNNSGAVNVITGTLSLNAGGTSGGTFNQASGTFTKFTGGTQTLNGGTQLTGAGRAQVAGVDGTVTFNGAITGPPSGGSFDVVSGTLNGSGSYTGLATWTGGTIGGTISLTSGSTMSISSAATKFLGAGAVLNNLGTITWSGTGDIRNNNGANGANSATINNKSGATFGFTTDGTPFTVDYIHLTFNNESGATLVKSGGSGSTVLQQITINNNGTIQCSTGTIQSGTNEHIATLNLNSGSVLAGAGVLQLRGNTVLNSEVNSGLNVVLAAGNLTGSYDVNNNPLASYKGAGRFDWTGGTINGNLSLALGSTMSVSGASTKLLGGGAILNNLGTVNWAGAGDIRNNNGANGGNRAIINNKSGGAFRLTTDGTPFTVDYIALTFNNEAGATLVKSGGSGVTLLQQTTINNSGTIRSDVGTLEYTSTLNSQSGSTFSGPGSHLASAGDLNVNGATTISSATFTVSGGNLSGNGGSVGTSGSGAFDWAGGAVNGTLNLASGTFRISGAATKLMGHGSVINNSGTLTWSGTGHILNNNGANPGNVATFNNKSSGVFNAQSSASFIRDYNPSTFNNEGIVNIGASPGILNMDWNYVQAGTGVLNVELGGTNATTPQFDQLKAVSATLAGTLNVGLINGFTPVSGNSFKIITGTRSGTFATVNGINLGGGKVLTAQYNTADVTLVDQSTPAATYTLSGRIATSANVAIANVKVTRTGSTTYATTDASGNYTFTGVPAGTYNITPTLAQYGFNPTFKAVAVTNANVTGVNFTGTRAMYTIRGRVTNHSGAALPNIQITRTGGPNVITDANGDYVFNVTSGDYTIAPLITPSLNGVTLFPASRNVTVNTSSLSNQNFTASFTVTGRVATSTGVGIPNIQVRRTAGASSVTTVTDANGNYRFTDVRSGAYTVQAVVTPSMTGVTFFPGVTNITVDKANLTNINFTAWFSVSGRVATSSGVGLANIQIKRQAGASVVTTVTDANGNYRFSDVRSGAYTLSPNITPSLAGMTFSPATINANVGTANLTNQNFTVWFTISGRVTESSTAQGIEGVQVKRTAGASVVSVFTDAQGNYRFPDTRSGDYTITAEMNGKTFTPASQAKTVGTQNITNVNFIGSG